MGDQEPQRVPSPLGGERFADGGFRRQPDGGTAQLISLDLLEGLSTSLGKSSPGSTGQRLDRGLAHERPIRTAQESGCWSHGTRRPFARCAPALFLGTQRMRLTSNMSLAKLRGQPTWRITSPEGDGVPMLSESPDVLVRLANVRKSYGQHEVLKGISLEVKRNEVLVIIGPSGGERARSCGRSIYSGRRTLARLAWVENSSSPL